MKLKACLIRLLEIHDMTAASLSRKSGVPKQTISDWLAGRKPRDLEQVRKVAQVFQMTVDELCFEGQRSDASSLINSSIGSDWITGIFEIKIRRVK